MSCNIDKNEVIKNLKELAIYIGIVCPWQDGSNVEKLMRMGNAVNDAITLLEGQE